MQIRRQNRAVLEEVENGTGTMNKLLHDESLYTELVESIKNFRTLWKTSSSSGKVYSFFFVGFKNERDNIGSKEERKLRKVLDSIQD